MTAGAPLDDRTTSPRWPDACILAGGKSRRMGRDKVLVDLGGSSLLERLLLRLRGLFTNVRVSVADAAQARELGQRLARCEAAAVPEFVEDGEPGRGPLEGIRSALESCASPLAFFVAVDMPFPSGALISLLWEEAEVTGARGAMPCWRRGLEPAFAVYSRALLDDLTAAIGAGHRSLHQMEHWDGVRIVDLESPSIRQRLGVRADRTDPERWFFNINTPADLERARAFLGDF